MRTHPRVGVCLKSKIFWRNFDSSFAATLDGFDRDKPIFNAGDMLSQKLPTKMYLYLRLLHTGISRFYYEKYPHN
jgi:hypothetical protein